MRRIIFALLLLGCNGERQFTYAGDDNEFDAGDAELELSASGGYGGEESWDSDAGSSGGTPSGGSGGSPSGGTGGSGGSVQCIPKTCVTLGVTLPGGGLDRESCGIVDDGCGNYIDCGGCSGSYEFCAQPDIIGVFDRGDPYPNICGGGCFSALQSPGSPTIGWVCAGSVSPPTGPGWECSVLGTGANETTWSCDPVATADTCDNGKIDLGETDIDCGGPTVCSRCSSGQSCSEGSDCGSGVCNSSMCQ